MISPGQILSCAWLRSLPPRPPVPPAPGQLLPPRPGTIQRDIPQGRGEPHSRPGHRMSRKGSREVRVASAASAEDGPCLIESPWPPRMTCEPPPARIASSPHSFPKKGPLPSQGRQPLARLHAQGNQSHDRKGSVDGCPNPPCCPPTRSGKRNGFGVRPTGKSPPTRPPAPPPSASSPRTDGSTTTPVEAQPVPHLPPSLPEQPHEDQHSSPSPSPSSLFPFRPSPRSIDGTR